MILIDFALRITHFLEFFASIFCLLILTLVMQVLIFVLYYLLINFLILMINLFCLRLFQLQSQQQGYQLLLQLLLQFWLLLCQFDCQHDRMILQFFYQRVASRITITMLSSMHDDFLTSIIGHSLFWRVMLIYCIFLDLCQSIELERFQ